MLCNFTIVHNGGALVVVVAAAAAAAAAVVVAVVVAIMILLGFVAVSIRTTYSGNESLLRVANAYVGT